MQYDRFDCYKATDLLPENCVNISQPSFLALCKLINLMRQKSHISRQIILEPKGQAPEEHRPLLIEIPLKPLKLTHILQNGLRVVLNLLNPKPQAINRNQINLNIISKNRQSHIEPKELPGCMRNKDPPSDRNQGKVRKVVPQVCV